MTDANQLFDYARKQFNDIAEDVERHFESVASQLRGYLPLENTPFARPPPPPRRLPPPSTLQLARRWVSRHQGVTAAAVAFLVTGSVGAFVFVQSRQSRRKRRAKKSLSGARTDVVVVVAGAGVADPLTCALYLDLERRGFVVYVVCGTRECEQYVRAQSRVDLLPLSLDVVDPFAARDQLARFKALLERDHFAFEGAEAHRLNFTGMIIVPGDTNQTTPALTSITDTRSEEWSHVLNAKVLNTIAMTQLFLPTLIQNKAKILFLAPSITPSLNLPGHAMETTVHGALSAFTSSLAAEMKPQGVSVSHFKLGNLDIPSVTIKQRRDGVSQPQSMLLKATPLRKLHDSVFDALVASRLSSGTYYIGQGSLAYHIIGTWLPPTIIGWMMGGRRQDPVVVQEVAGEEQEDMVGSQGSLTWEKV